jgi:hypothetical protein
LVGIVLRLCCRSFTVAAKTEKAKDIVRKLEVLKETLESPTAIEERNDEEENAQSNIAYLASKRAEYGAIAAELQAWFRCLLSS